MYENRRFMIFDTSEILAINYTQVLETSPETLRLSADGTKTFVKWEGDMPVCVRNLWTKSGPHTYDEILVILETPDWKQDPGMSL
jgi:hypothetical protein